MLFPFSFLIIWLFSFFLVNLKGLLILLIFSKNQLLISWIFAIIFLVYTSLIFALIFIVSFFLLALSLVYFLISSFLGRMLRLIIWDLSSFLMWDFLLLLISSFIPLCSEVTVLWSRLFCRCLLGLVGLQCCSGLLSVLIFCLVLSIRSSTASTLEVGCWSLQLLLLNCLFLLSVLSDLLHFRALLLGTCIFIIVMSSSWFSTSTSIKCSFPLVAFVLKSVLPHMV